MRRLSLLLAVLLASSIPAQAQQAVRIPMDEGGRTIQLTAQFYRPAGTARVPAVAIFHGCGGVGVNNTRMAGLLRDWGYAALVVDSFSARHMTDVCGRHWPTQADADKRVQDIAMPCVAMQAKKEGKSAPSGAPVGCLTTTTTDPRRLNARRPNT